MGLHRLRRRKRGILCEAVDEDGEYAEDAEEPSVVRRLQRDKTFASRANRAAAASGMESTSYEDYWSPQYVDYLSRIGALSESFLHFRIFRWALLCLIGLVTGFIAIAVDFSMHELYELKMRSNNLFAWYGAAIWQQYLGFVGVCVCFASVAGFLVCYVEVLAAGSGIPEIKCYLNGINFPNVVGVRTLCCKATGIVFSVAAGLPCGKEGPMIHSGAIVGGLMASGCDVKNRIKPLNIDEELRDLVAAGAAAGVSAAFGAPMGGVLFAVEEGSSHMSPVIMVRLFVACAFANLVSRLFAGREHDLPFGVLGSQVPVSFGKFDSLEYYIFEFPIYLMMAVMGGLLGAGFNKVNKRISKWRQRNIGSTGHRRFLEVIALTVIVSSTQYFIPVVAHGADKAVGIKNLTATESMFWQSGIGSLRAVFHSDAGTFDMGLLSVFAIMNLTFSCVLYGVGVPSGLFVPSLLTGASFGRLVGEQLQFWHFGYNLEHKYGVHIADPGFYALLGSVAMLAGTARITISLALIIVEVTGISTVSLPIFWTVMIAKFTGDYFGRGIYDMHIVELKHIPLLEHDPELEMIRKQAKHIMAEDVVTMDIICTIGKVLETMDSCSHQAFPVLHPRNRTFLGMVSRDVLKTVLRSGNDQNLFQDPAGPLRNPAPMTPYEDVGVDEVSFQRKDLEKRIDLTPYVNYSCHTMPEHSSVSSCYRLFRQLGLRHLTIVNTSGHVVGILTRKDLVLDEDSSDEDDGGSLLPGFEGDAFEAEDDIVALCSNEYIVSAESAAGFGGPGIG